MSLDCAHDVAIDVAAAELTMNELGADGGVVSGHADVLAVVPATVDTFPAASNAWTPSV